MSQYGQIDLFRGWFDLDFQIQELLIPWRPPIK